MVAKFLDYNKPKIYLKSEFVLFHSSILFNSISVICQMLAKCSGLNPKEKGNFCVVLTYSGARVKLGSFMSQSQRKRNAELCSSRARWPLVPNFYPWATSKSQIFHTNHMPGTLDFTLSEHWAPFSFP